MKTSGRRDVIFIFIISTGLLLSSCGKGSQKFSGYPDRRGDISPIRSNGSDASGGQSAGQVAASASFRLNNANIGGAILPAISTSSNFTIVAEGMNAN